MSVRRMVGEGGRIVCLAGSNRALAGTAPICSNPMFHGRRGQGASPYPPEATHEPWCTTDVRFVLPTLADSPLTLESPRVGKGACDTSSAADTHSFRHLSTGQASEDGELCPLASPTRVAPGPGALP